MKLAGFVVASQTETSPAAPVVVCSVQKRGQSLCANDLCTSQVQFDVPQSDLFQLDGAFEPGPAYALWNNEWSSLPRHWTLVYHKCQMQVADDTHYSIVFDGEDVVRQVPIEVQLTDEQTIPGCVVLAPLTPDFVQSVPDYNPAWVQYPIVSIDLDVIEQLMAPIDDSDRGQPLDRLEGYVAESGAWHRWDVIKTLNSQAGLAVAPYVLNYGSGSK